MELVSSMLDTVYVQIRHMEFWFGQYGLRDKSCNDEITIYSDPIKTNKLGYFEITTHISLAYVLKYELNEQEDYKAINKIKKFLNSDSQIFFNYNYPRNDDDLLFQVRHFAPVNRKKHKPTYINMWTKLSDRLDINEIIKCVKILLREFFHENVSNVKVLDIPTYDETKKFFEDEYLPHIM